MNHIRRITVAKADALAKDDDPMGQAFLALWVTVMSWMLAGAFGSGK